MRNLKERRPTALLIAGVDFKPAKSTNVVSDVSDTETAVAPTPVDLMDDVRSHAAKCQRELIAARAHGNPHAIAGASRLTIIIGR